MSNIYDGDNIMKTKFKKIKQFIHDLFFREVYSHTKYALDIFRLILTKSEYNLFNWDTLTCEQTTFFNKQGREKRMDLAFSVQIKNSDEKIKLLFLLEHKSWQDPKVMQQMLMYQASMYESTNCPIIPVLVYQGKHKEYTGPLSFHKFLHWTSVLNKHFKQNVLNFTPRLLNIQALDIEKEAKGLLTRPILYILKHIWRLDELKVRELFTLGQELSYEERKELVGRAADYMRNYDPNFSFNVAREIEAKTITDKEERIMTPLLQHSLEEAKAEGMHIGRLEGKEEGRLEKERQVIANMFQKNLNVSLIADVTGLSEAEIKKFKNGSN